MQTTVSISDIPMSAEERDQFLEDGFIGLSPVIDEEELDILGEIYDRLFSETAQDDQRRKQLGGRDEQGRATLPQILGPNKLAPEMMELKYWKRCEAMAKYIFGEEATITGSHAIFKPAGYGAATPWHQDQAYHHPGKRYKTVNFWLPIDGATIEGGCMQYVRASHHGPIVPHEFLIPGDKKSALVASGQDYWQANGVAVPLDRGGVSLHHSYCMHYAAPNTSDVPRRALILNAGIPPVELDEPWTFTWSDGPV